MNDKMQIELAQYETMRAFEKTTTKNVQTCVKFGNDTRALFRELELKVEHLTDLMLHQNELIETLKKQLAFVQQKQSVGGTE